MSLHSHLLEQPLYAWREVGLKQAPELLPGQGLQPRLATQDYPLGGPAPAASLDLVDLAIRVNADPPSREEAATARAPILRRALLRATLSPDSKVCIPLTP